MSANCFACFDFWSHACNDIVFLARGEICLSFLQEHLMFSGGEHVFPAPDAPVSNESGSGAPTNDAETLAVMSAAEARGNIK